MSAALTTTGIYGLGYLAKKYKIVEKYDKLYIAIIFLFTNILFMNINTQLGFPSLDINSAQFGVILFTYISAISGILFIIILSTRICNASILSSFLKYIGRNSLWFFPLLTYIPVTTVELLHLYSRIQVNNVIKILTKFEGFIVTMFFIEVIGRFKRYYLKNEKH